MTNQNIDSKARRNRKGRDLKALRSDFTRLPIDACHLTGPLLWLHGTESKEKIEKYIGLMAQNNNGYFVAESRPHNDWLGPRWYEDLKICIEAAKKHNLRMTILDEKWWPSQTVDGRVPVEYHAKTLDAEAVLVTGPVEYESEIRQDKYFISVLAGKAVGDAVDGDSILDITGCVKGGTLKWNAGDGDWKVMIFRWKAAGKTKDADTGEHYCVDGASKDCVEWFLNKVYQPHFEHLKDDFGETIVSFFHDEPETIGDWGTEMAAMFEELGYERKKAYVAYKFELAGDQQAAGKYAYMETFFETWGRTLYGGMATWCQERGVESLGHFMDHMFEGKMLYLDHGLGAGNIMQMGKYAHTPGMDMVCEQVYPDERSADYQLPKMASSVSHAYNKRDHLTMGEMFGGYGQKLTYLEMKWLVDHHQLRGVNNIIAHSFNPKAPNDTDYPPYFYNGGQEPRWPLYHVWSDYTNRLSLMLTGGVHVCPVAMLFCGNSYHVGEAVLPENMTSLLQDCLFDVDWIPYEVLEDTLEIKDKSLVMENEKGYKVLIVPPVEAIPYKTLERVKEFFETGGVVIGYEYLPSKSATLGKSSLDIARLRDSIWKNESPSLKVSRKNDAGGRTYFLPHIDNAFELEEVLVRDAGVHPTLEISKTHFAQEGRTENPDWKWLHVLHRIKDGYDVFLICNQYIKGQKQKYTFIAHAQGTAECWDPMRNEILSIPFKRINSEIAEFELTLEAYESVMIVFRPDNEEGCLKDIISPERQPEKIVELESLTFELNETLDTSNRCVYLEIDEIEGGCANIKINGVYAGGFLGKPYRLEVSKYLRKGINTFEVCPNRPENVCLKFYER